MSSQSLTVRLCRAISNTIMTHPEQVDANEIVGCLMVTVATHGFATLGVEKTLIQLANQMAIISGYNMDRVQSVIDRTKVTVETQKASPGYGALLGL